MTVYELAKLYHNHNLPTDARIVEGREPITRYHEGRIISEMDKLVGLSPEERTLVERCRKDYELEMRNLSLVFRLPLGDIVEDLQLDPNHNYTPNELSALIDLFNNPRTFLEREFLVGTVDRAIDIIAVANNKQSVSGLAAQLVELDRTKIVKCPGWVLEVLRESVDEWISAPSAADTAMVLPMLTLAFIDKNWKLQRRAQRIINRCYLECKEGRGDSESLCTSVNYNSYVTRFSTRKIAAAWCGITDSLKGNLDALSVVTIIRLLTVAKHIEEFLRLPVSLKQPLLDQLAKKAKESGFPAQACADKLVSVDNSVMAKAV